MQYRGITYIITYFPKEGGYRFTLFAPEGNVIGDSAPSWDTSQTEAHKAIDKLK